MATGNIWYEDDGYADDRELLLSEQLSELDMDDTLPEPIYIKNSELREMRRYMNRIAESDDAFSCDEDENEEGNLDLTAPPLES